MLSLPYANMSDSASRKKKNQELESNLAQLRIFGAQVRDKVIATPDRSKTSLYGTPQASLQSPLSSASLSRESNAGAYQSPAVSVSISHKHTPPRPLEISTLAGNKYKIFITPSDDSFDNICFSTKGSGGDTFCTNSNCKIASHKTKPKFAITKGDICLEKTSGAAFSRVFLNSSSLDPSLLESWEFSMNTMEDWIALFDLASSSLKKEPPWKLNFKDLQQALSEKLKIREWKTPMKRKMKLESFQSSKHQRLIPEDTKSFSLEQLSVFLVDLDKRLTELMDGVDLLREIQVEDSTLVYDYFSSADDKMEAIMTSIGSRPPDLDPTSNAPDLWLAVTSIISKLKHVPLEMTQLISKLTKPIQEAVDRKLDKKEGKQSLDNLDHQLSQLHDYCLALTKEVSAQYQSIFNNTSPLSPSPVNQTLLASNLSPHLSQTDLELDKQLASLEGEVKTLASVGDKSVIAYGDLGFRTLGDAATWLNDNFISSTGLFGYLLDFHMMMQHISSESSSGLGTTDKNVSKRMGQATKLNFNGIAETTAVDSFGF